MILEDFSRGADILPAPPRTDADLFDRGYSQGWEDAAAKIRADDLRVAARLATHLEAMTHSQGAAVSLCLAQIEPLLSEIFDKMLPRAADRAFLGLILQEAETLLAGAGGKVLALRVAPEAVGPLHAFLEAGEADLDAMRIEAEPGLSPLQARLSHPGAEREIDLASLLDAMDDAFENFRQTERIRTDE